MDVSKQTVFDLLQAINNEAIISTSKLATIELPFRFFFDENYLEMWPKIKINFHSNARHTCGKKREFGNVDEVFRQQ